MNRPIIDIHCDLLIYLTRKNSNIETIDDIGCSLPHLKAGNVKLQTMAIFAPTEPNSHKLGLEQSHLFKDLKHSTTRGKDLYEIEKVHLNNLDAQENIGMVASIENASAFCDEAISLKEGFENLAEITANVGKLFYISLTHHAENRFGGGNYSSVGLKDDGRALIDYMAGKQIALDFSHTSDALATDILTYLTKENLNIPIIASHSNYRPVWDHTRNLPADIAKEIIRKKGLIGVNFLRAFVNNDDTNVLYDHISYGLELGGKDAICYGADYFFTGTHPDPSRIPFYFPEHENAGKYQDINAEVEKRFGSEFCDKLSYKNAERFLNELWK